MNINNIILHILLIGMYAEMLKLVIRHHYGAVRQGELEGGRSNAVHEIGKQVEIARSLPAGRGLQ